MSQQRDLRENTSWCSWVGPCDLITTVVFLFRWWSRFSSFAERWLHVSLAGCVWLARLELLCLVGVGTGLKKESGGDSNLDSTASSSIHWRYRSDGCARRDSRTSARSHFRSGAIYPSGTVGHHGWLRICTIFRRWVDDTGQMLRQDTRACRWNSHGQENIEYTKTAILRLLVKGKVKWRRYLIPDVISVVLLIIPNTKDVNVKSLIKGYQVCLAQKQEDVHSDQCR